MKRKICVLLAALIIMSLLPMSAFAANGDKLIAITFDDGPSKFTPDLLDGLKARDAKCTFFIVGGNAASNGNTIKRMWEEGHEVANHTYNHTRLTTLSGAEVSSNLRKTDEALNNAIGFNINHNLRPPYGSVNSTVLENAGRPCFYWSVDTRDWESRNADSVYNQIMKNTKDGSVVLLHDIYSTSVTGVLRAIDSLKAKGYQFVTVSELFYRRGITLENGVMYYNAYPGAYGTSEAIKEPVISVADVEQGKQVSISGDSRGAVYYTTNGQIPNPSNSTKYTGPFYVEANTTVKAVSAIDWNGLRSNTVSKYIEYSPAATPVIIHSGSMISMSSATKNAQIYYTTDCSEPTTGSQLYNQAINFEKGTTYKARAYAKGFDPSPTAMLTCSARGNFFEDISVKDWCYDAVDRAVSEGIFKGVTSTSFQPDRTFNRAMLVTVLYRMAGSPDVSGKTMPFKDVSSSYWAYKEIVWGYNAGIIEGYSDGNFKPSVDISRQALCAMIARYARFMGTPLKTESNVVNNFKDADNISKAFRDDVNTLSALAIVKGYADGTMRPLNNATRAQAATMLLRFEDVIAAQTAGDTNGELTPPTADAPSNNASAEEEVKDEAPTEGTPAPEILEDATTDKTS